MRSEHAAGTLAGAEAGSGAPAAGQAPPTKAGDPDPKAGKGGRRSAPGNAAKPAGAKAAADSTTDPGPATAPSSVTGVAAAFETAQEALDAYTKAFEEQNVDELARISGKPRAFFEVTDAKWAAFREEKRTFRAEKAQHQSDVAALTARAAAVEGARSEAAAEYGTAIKAAEAYRNGDYEAFATLVAELAKEDYDTAQANVISGALSLDPATKAERKKLAEAQRKIDALEARLAGEDNARKETKEQLQERAYQATVAALETDIGNHECKAIKGYQRQILDKIRESWNGKAYELSFVDAADELVTERDEEAAARGYVRAAPGTPPARQQASAPVIPPRGRAASTPAATPAKWETEDVDDDDIIADLKREHRAAARNT
jgi:hypothetical protein